MAYMKNTKREDPERIFHGCGMDERTAELLSRANPKIFFRSLRLLAATREAIESSRRGGTHLALADQIGSKIGSVIKSR